MAAKHEHSSSVVLAAAAHHVVLEVGLGHVQRRVHLHLEDVFSGPYVCDVHPLAVNVVPVGVPAAYGDPLVAHVVAGEALL